MNLTENGEAFPGGNERPESLPQQVRRLSKEAGEAAYPVRAWWTPPAIVLASLLLSVGLLTLSKTVPYGSRPWLVQQATLVLYGVAGAPVTLVGLWVALRDRSTAYRWGSGLIVIGLFSIRHMAGQIPMFSAISICYAIGGSLYQLAYWASVGFVVRVVGRRVYGVTSGSHDKAGLSIADLILLTTAWAGSFAMKSFGQSLFGSDVETIEFTLPLNELIGYLEPLVTGAPLLWGAFQLGGWSWRRLLVGALASWALSVGWMAVSFAYLASQQSAGFTFTPDYSGMAVNQIGPVLGVVGASLCLRWAGYRLRKAGAGVVAEGVA